MIPSECVCVKLLSHPVQILMNRRHPQQRHLCYTLKVEQDRYTSFSVVITKLFLLLFFRFFVIFPWILG
jgi:hypothetical protein